MCSFHDMLCLQRLHPPTIGFTTTSTAINERKTPKTNHKGSISHHIIPLVINSLRDRHTHTQTHTHIADKSNFKKPGERPARAWFNKDKTLQIVPHHDNTL